MAEDFFNKSHLMEVHLNIQSSLNLQPLADAFGSSVHVHFSKVVNGVYGVRVVLSEFLEFPDPTVISLCKAVCELPESARILWNSASVRTFDIGIEAAVCSTYWFALTPQTLNTLAALGAQVVVTVYGPDRKEDESRADAIRRVQQADFRIFLDRSSRHGNETISSFESRMSPETAVVGE